MEKELATYIVGMHYLEDNIEAIGQKNAQYSKSDRTLHKIYPDGKRVYAYFFPIQTGKIVVDKSAKSAYSRVQLVVGGKVVGYIPEDMHEAVLSALKTAREISVKITGGPFKDVARNDVTPWKNGYKIDVVIRYETAGDPAPISAPAAQSVQDPQVKARPLPVKWIIIGVVAGVLLLVGAIRAAVPKPAADAPADEAVETVAPSDPEPVSDPEPAEDPQPSADEEAQAALSEALGGASLLFSDSVRNDSTGKWRMLRVSSAAPIHEHLGEYAAAFIRADDEVHVVINFALSTTTVITSGSGVLYVSVYQYADGEEHDAKLIPGGEKLAEYIYTVSTGALEAVE